jgi:hypothetical protein
VRVCSRRCAPRGVHCICCRFANRLPMTVFTVDSTKARNAFASSELFAIVDDAVRVVGNLDSELVGRLGEPSQVRIINVERIDASFEIFYQPTGPMEVAIPEQPFDPLDLGEQP